MISVAEADKIILEHTADFGSELLGINDSHGKILAQDITADRDLPPYDRVTMDGIAIHYESFRSGVRSFSIKATQAAGTENVNINKPNECIEIMTGAMLPQTTDTVVRYEDLEIKDGIATIVTEHIKQGQNIHTKGIDCKAGEVIVKANCTIDATVISVAASVGSSHLRVKKIPRVMIISTGNEVVEISASPQPQQIRQSNNHTIKAVLREARIDADMLHLHDDKKVIRDKLEPSLTAYDVIILTGGVSMGKYDLVPGILEELGVIKLFHKVKQRPGKPFWFGKYKEGTTVFALPGNPVSAFMCVHRYFFPWLYKCLGRTDGTAIYAALDTDYSFMPDLQYFLQVQMYMTDAGQLLAKPVAGNGSGDFVNLTAANAFIELPAEKGHFKKGEVYRIWPFKPLFCF